MSEMDRYIAVIDRQAVEIGLLREAMDAAHEALRLAEDMYQRGVLNVTTEEWDQVHAARRAALSKGPTP
jgi:hypothetical protein